MSEMGEANDPWTPFVLGILVGIPIGMAVFWGFVNFSKGELSPPLETSKLEAAQRNEEIWRWKDWRGREREITVHREVKRRVP